MSKDIYEKMTKIADFHELNEVIREQIKKSKSRQEVEELLRKSRALVDMLSPYNTTGLVEAYTKLNKLDEARVESWEEYIKTLKIANENRHGGEEYSTREKPKFIS